MIDNCPACRYSLAGLPDEHVCPECGFSYERDAAVVEEYRYTGRYYMVFVGLPLLVVIGGWIYTGGFGSFFTVLIILPPILGGLWQARRPRNAVVLSRKSVRFLRGGVVGAVFPLAEINRAEWSVVDGAVAIKGINGERLHTLTYYFLGSHSRAKEVVTLINEQVKASRSSEGES